MDHVGLFRLETSPQGTFGKLVLPNGLRLFTGELPWRDNQPQVSCIPVGLYRVVWGYSPHLKHNAYLVQDVARRFGIRIHAANLMGETAIGLRAQVNGCIALGEKLGTMEGQKALLVSAPAITKLEAVMERKPFILEVRESYEPA